MQLAALSLNSLMNFISPRRSFIKVLTYFIETLT